MSAKVTYNKLKTWKPATRDKILRLGTNTTENGRRYSVYARVLIEKGELKISGVEGPLPTGNAIGSSGQLLLSDDNNADVKCLTIEKLAPKWNHKMLMTFSYVWKRWHLNHTRHTCEHQRELGQTWRTHPAAKCLDCGYKLGTEWKREELPTSVVTFLNALPETDQTPSWV